MRPLLRQQIEWNIRQEMGQAKRAVLLGNTSYPGHVTPLNDIKDITTLLDQSGFCLENSFENVSATKFQCILEDYVECMNKLGENIGKKFYNFDCILSLF